MKLLMLNPFFYPYQGGTEKHLLEVGERLAKKHEVTVLTAKIKGTAQREKIRGVNVYRTQAWRVQKAPHPIPPPIPIMPRLLSDLRKLAQENDVVHVHNRFVYGLNETSLVKKLDRKLCLTLHNARPKGIDFATDFWGQAYDRSIGRIVMNRCDGVLAVSKATLESTLPKKYEGVTGIAYNGVDSKLFNPKNDGAEWRARLTQQGLEEGERIILTNARLVKQKGIVDLIDAMHFVRNARLVVFGRGPLLKKLQNRAKKKKVSAFFVTERLSDESLARLYAASDVFVLPSLWEPFGMVLAEAMAAGKPAVGTRIGGIPEIIQNNKNGLLAPPHDPRELAHAINRVLDDDKLARRLARAGRKTAAKKFTWDNCTLAYEKFYRQLE
ncbi:glycosyltransferase family 4 protein [Candidatus Micrarchaeota archaeon]|nr:glycosyltransferase family 4 protein [Candidatus Micrarchaeota archaeon]